MMKGKWWSQTRTYRMDRDQVTGRVGIITWDISCLDRILGIWMQRQPMLLEQEHSGP